jgi:hypothetical protein
MELSNVSFAVFPKFDIQLHNKFHNFFSQLVEQVENGWCNIITFIETRGGSTLEPGCAVAHPDFLKN